MLTAIWLPIEILARARARITTRGVSHRFSQRTGPVRRIVPAGIRIREEESAVVPIWLWILVIGLLATQWPHIKPRTALTIIPVTWIVLFVSL